MLAPNFGTSFFGQILSKNETHKYFLFIFGTLSKGTARRKTFWFPKFTKKKHSSSSYLKFHSSELIS